MSDRVESEVRLGFFMIKNCVMESYDLTIGAFWLYSCLTKYSHGKGFCFPSVKTLSGIARSGPKESGVSEQAIRNWTEELVEKKLISVSEQLGKGKTYKLLDVIDKLPGQPGLTGQPGLADPSTSVGLTPQPGLTLIRRIEEEKEEEKEEADPTPSSPQPGGGNSETRTAMYDFGTFKSLYPDHRMWKNERAARDEWNALNGDSATKVKIISHLSAMLKSKDWTAEGGRYVPKPQNYLAQRYWEHTGPAAKNHREECEVVLKEFLAITDQNRNLHSLTESRYEMLSARWDDAIDKAEHHTPENAMLVTKAAMEAAHESHLKRKIPKRLTLESIFESTEKFERWIAEAYEQ